jgi:hypothetical protein
LEDPEEKIMKIQKKWKGRDGRIVWIRTTGIGAEARTAPAPTRARSNSGFTSHLHSS